MIDVLMWMHNDFDCSKYTTIIVTEYNLNVGAGMHALIVHACIYIEIVNL